ncbi:MAG: AP2/ERF family transcription factor [Oscillospiraceae bacterium]|nr:AP2/ERF family transcription factor [Oscillospiraceae bacterium]
MEKKADISGQRFGRLIAVRPTEKRSSGYVVWECQCDCGKSVLRSIKSLRSGTTKSCGCGRYRIRDLTNQRFGKLIAIRPTEQRSGKSVVWECQCDCGNATFVPTLSLTSGRTKSCGCNLIKDITGQRFGKLTALYRTDQRSKDSVLWECQCDCGNTVLRTTNDLTSGHTTSCGCKRHEAKDITGQRFGRLTVLRPTDQRRSESVVWECQCDCGNIVLTIGNHLRSGATKSCGCWRKEKLEEAWQEFRAKTCIDGTNTTTLCQRPGSRNTTGVVGVSYEPKRDIWIARIVFKGETYCLGTYRNKEEAVIARKKAEEALHVRFLELCQQGLISPDAPGFSDEAIVFDYEQVLSRHKYPDCSSRQQGTKRRFEKSSKYVGVTFRKDTSRWRAYISQNCVTVHLGSFDTEELAAEAYDEKAKELYGEHARLNFPIKTDVT